jgi:hypothetical protein
VWLTTAGGITDGLIEDDSVAFAGMGNHGGGAFPQKRIVMVQQYGHNSSFLQRIVYLF